mmetsp:Transcript_137350/g.342530  ORF Transcript_137350/g.342530 Transcript_137350/m.342530 type:complete len:210 (+) Transcript_137350:1412-2041(+)
MALDFLGLHHFLSGFYLLPRLASPAPWRHPAVAIQLTRTPMPVGARSLLLHVHATLHHASLVLLGATRRMAWHRTTLRPQEGCQRVLGRTHLRPRHAGRDARRWRHGRRAREAGHLRHRHLPSWPVRGPRSAGRGHLGLHAFDHLLEHVRRHLRRHARVSPLRWRGHVGHRRHPGRRRHLGSHPRGLAGQRLAREGLHARHAWRGHGRH